MKKLMIAAAVALTAVASQAATVAWKMDADSSRSYAYNTVYMINAADSAAVLAALGAGGASIGDKLDDYNMFADPSVLSYKGAGSGTSAGGDLYTTDSYMWLVVKTGEGQSVQDGLTYKMTDAISYATLSTAKAIGEGAVTGEPYVLVNTSTDLFTGASGTIGEAVPEPTSGLLLLLGVAGLALKRRRV